MSLEDGKLVGNPITIHFSREVPVLRITELLFSSDEPFRLWGIPDFISDTAARVYAVDMHHGNTGNKLMFEITSRFLRVTIPRYSCANTVLRLFANINHFVDAMATLEVVDYELKVDLPGTRLS
jgi:hypothetical protein